MAGIPVTNGLAVKLGTTKKRRSCWGDTGEMAWRVYVIQAKMVLPMAFARQCDAERAIRAIAGFIDWHVSDRELVAHFQDKSARDELRRRMVEAMAW